MAEDIRQFVEFKLSDEEYGIDILQVKTIERMMPITRVPKTPDFVEGVINLRGEIVPVIDLKKRFDLPPGEVTDSTRIIIASIDDITVGMIVDAATEVIQLSQDDIEPAPPIIGGIDANYLDGVGKIDGRLLILLNVAKLLKPQEINQLAQM
ncbi:MULTISPECIES: chemotaxis protein CheW [Tepidanaerobacter]|uniref:Chemotaxis protein CheW n=1 Tax=Tepidanaerobacter syntrophicus TaxID=224999 RepID=A0A0U9HHB0_9FIRM|nr:MULTISPECIES: chemotaxis protein CheW [Tepidanaerobacter]GAQ26233.1 purine-binding chemotaxis protein CheW [Tepidanaerobacter syntrophicus]GLI19221.1 chemotaxis protein CheW [Tepidanaerobacter syntrophicus]GLI50146.1 chemotaxis protein CheW [Tepidanaerobacter syntrophicus]HHV83553.1 chemotaxis protein CheW [Tepidanaerobacter syntrophicus]